MALQLPNVSKVTSGNNNVAVFLGAQAVTMNKIFVPGRHRRAQRDALRPADPQEDVRRVGSFVWIVGQGGLRRFRSVSRRAAPTLPARVDPEVSEWTAPRRAELDELEEQLVRQPDQVRAEQDEIVVGASPPAQVGGRAVPLVPHRRDSPDETALPGAYRRILAVVRAVGGPV